MISGFEDEDGDKYWGNLSLEKKEIMISWNVSYL
jgi:hypothetical protein